MRRERVRTTPWTRNSNSLLLVALRAPPAVSSEAISLWSPSTLVLPLFCLSLSLASLPFHPSLTSSTPLRGSLLHFPYFLLSLSLSVSECAALSSLSLSLCLSRLRFGWAAFQEPGCERTWGVESWGSFRGVPAGPPWPCPPPPFTNTLTEKHTRSQAAAAVAFHW